MLLGYLAIFFLLVFLVALGLTAFFLTQRERAVHSRRPSATAAARPDLPHPRPPGAARSPLPLTDFERLVLREIYGMSNEEILFSEALLKHRDREGRVYVTSENRPDGFFQC
jgi:hypothetical protein